MATISIPRVRLVKVPRRTALVALIVPATLVLMVAMIWTGRLDTLMKLVLVALFAAYSFHEPLPAVFVAMVVGTRVFEFVSLERLPYFQIASGLRINMSDAFTLLFLAIAAHRLPRRKDRPLFGGLVVIWVLLVAVSFAAALVLGETDIDTGGNILRGQVGYLGYLSMIAILDTHKRFRWYVRFLTVMVLIAVAIQLVEAVLGYRLSLGALGGVSNVYFASTKFVEIGDTRVPYLWSRSLGHTILLMFLALGCVFEGKRLRRYLPLAVLAILSYLITLSRAWYIAIAVGIATLFVLQRRRGWAIGGSVLLIVSLIGVGAVLGWMGSEAFGMSPWKAWVSRALTLQDLSSESNFVGRVELNSQALRVVWDSPLLGWGPGFVFTQHPPGDLGIISTLVLYGFVGAAIILGLYLYVWWRGYQLWRRLPPCEEKGYILGLLALMVARLAISFSNDPLSGGGLAVTAAFFIDRVDTFHRAGLIGVQENAEREG